MFYRVIGHGSELRCVEIQTTRPKAEWFNFEISKTAHVLLHGEAREGIFSFDSNVYIFSNEKGELLQKNTRVFRLRWWRHGGLSVLSQNNTRGCRVIVYIGVCPKCVRIDYCTKTQVTMPSMSLFFPISGFYIIYYRKLCIMQYIRWHTRFVSCYFSVFTGTVIFHFKQCYSDRQLSKTMLPGGRTLFFSVTVHVNVLPPDNMMSFRRR